MYVCICVCVCVYVYTWCISFRRSVIELFGSHGVSTVINDNIVDNMLTISHMIIGSCGMITGYLYCNIMNYLHYEGMFTGMDITIISSLGFVSGFMMSTLTLTLISSAVSTVYVCYIDNPSALKVRYRMGIVINGIGWDWYSY